MEENENDEVLRQQMMEVMKDLGEGKTVGALAGFTPDDLEAVYSLGYASYQAGKFDEAEKVFRFVCLFDHLEKKYFFALGGALQAQRKFAEAVPVYASVMLRDVDDMQAYLRLAECQLALGERGEAVSALECALGRPEPADEANRGYRAEAVKALARLKGGAK